MPAVEKIRVINAFYGGMVRDDKSTILGAASNIEELDIFSSRDYIQPEQIFSADTPPTGSEIYAYDAGDDDTVYAYGRETTGGKVRLLSVASGGSDNPGSFATLFTSTDTTNLATRVGDLKFFRTTEAQPTYLYYIAGSGSSWSLKRYNITAATEATVGTLSGLSGSFDRPTMKVIFGELYICHGQYIAKVNSAGAFTEKAFTLPNEWQAVDLIAVSDIAIILGRNKNRLVNYAKGFWWDLASSNTVDDSFDIPMGGPQWIVNYKEAIRMLCAINGKAKIFQLTAAAVGARVVELPGILLANVGAETSTVPISAAKMVGTKDGLLYFALYKTDKTGVYALSQLDLDKPNALILSKRFSTSDYSLHKPTALLIHGANYYGAFNNNGTETAVRCETNNNPARSSSAVYESIWLDFGDQLRNKSLLEVYLATYPLSASTSLALSVASDYGSYSAYTRPDGSDFNTLNGVLGFYKTNITDKKVYKLKIAFTSSGTSGVKLVQIGMKYCQQLHPAASAT